MDRHLLPSSISLGSGIWHAAGNTVGRKVEKGRRRKEGGREGRSGEGWREGEGKKEGERKTGQSKSLMNWQIRSKAGELLKDWGSSGAQRSQRR